MADDPRDLVARGEVAKALARYREILAEDPDNVYIRIGLAEAQALSGEKEEAADALDKMVPELEENGFLVMAMKAQQCLAKIKPNDPEVRRRLNELYTEASRFSMGVKVETEAKAAPTQQIRYPVLRMSLFAELKDDEWEALVEGMTRRVFKGGSEVVKEGGRDSSMYFVATGEVSVETEGPGETTVRLGTIPAGSFFGEVSLLRGVPRIATVIAKTDCTILELTRTAFLNMTRQHVGVRKKVEQSMRRRIRRWRQAKSSDD